MTETPMRYCPLAHTTRSAVCVNSIRRPQLEPRDSEGDIDANRALQRDRLQRERASGATDQYVGADTGDEADIT